MSKGKGGGGEGWWLFAGLGLLALTVYYSETGREENNSALIPDSIEGRIDFVVAVLSERFTRRWVDVGFAALKSYFDKTYPAVAKLVNVVVQVEHLSKGQPMSSYDKQQTAMRMARMIGA